MEFNDCLILNHDADWTIAINHMKTIAAAKKIMALPTDHLSRRFARLPVESPLLSFNPTKLANYGQTHRFVADSEGRSNANTPGWRIHPEVKVLYILPYDLDRKA
jgi:hypothetical protein